MKKDAVLGTLLERIMQVENSQVVNLAAYIKGQQQIYPICEEPDDYKYLACSYEREQ